MVPGGVSVAVRPLARFLPPGIALNHTEQAAATAVQAMWDHYDSSAAEAAAQAELFTDLSGQSATGYASQVRNLTASLPGALAVTTIGTARAFVDAARDCPAANGAGASVIVEASNCVWVRVLAGAAQYGTNAAYTGYDLTQVTQQIGGQTEFAPGWFVGGSLGAQENRLETSGGVESGTGTAPLLSLSLKREAGPWRFSGSFAAGVESMSVTRGIAPPDPPGQATSSPEVDFQLLQARAGRDFAQGDWYARPMLDVDVLRVGTDGFAESGGGSRDLSFAGASHVVASVTPSVEVGGRLTRPTVTVWPFASLGVTGVSASSLTTTATLLGRSFDVKTPVPDVVGHAAIGLDTARRDGLDLKLQVGVDVGAHYTAETGLLRLAYAF